jgi:hypothetical protein
MNRDVVLWRVAVAHVGLLALLLIAQHLLGFPHRGALLGGGLVGFSFVTFWIVARSITDPRRKGLAVALGTLKVALYLGISAAVLGGRLVADGGGFALGVSCFVAATLIVALVWPIRAEAAGMARD